MARAPKKQRRGARDPADARSEVRSPAVVALCASAGGLDAFKAFLTAMPGDSGMAFVLVPHLDPTHKSLLVDLLARATPMPVREAAEGTVVEPDHVYVLPPNKYMTIAGGILHLTGPVERGGMQTSIDLFLRSLADDQQEKAIGIVLSGTGAHGTLGLEAIKAAGGLVMVQDPATATHAGMPSSAVGTGIADYVLPVEQMPETIARYVQHRGASRGEEGDLGAAVPELDAILALVEARTGIDFRAYRKKVLWRRIDRRMALGHTAQVADYLNFLRSHPDEVLRLHRDLLIRVTSFFRDAEAFEALTKQVLVPLLRNKAANDPVRVWVPACATGEEAYSIAMLCIEQLAAADKDCPLQVFATDVDDAPLEVARRGVYAQSITADVSEARLARFFTRMGAGYVVRKEVRAALVIAQQNLITDAPFSKLDLIACRNLLIYLEPDVQERVLSLFHFALGEGGCLLLGSSETIGRQADLFEPMSRKWRLFRRIGPDRPERVAFPVLSASGPAGAPRLPPGEPRSSSLAAVIQRVLRDELAPAAVLVDQTFRILHYYGAARRYLDHPVGEPTQDLLALAAGGLRTRLRSALRRALQEGEPAVVPDAQVKRDGRYVRVRATVKPIGTGPRLFLVRFEETAEPAPSSPDEEPLVHQLEHEVKALREDFQANIEELERSNEDLKTAHEEVLSMNEELQSANEELETSKEELQSLNEEISTVNSQLQDKVEELERAHSDLTNLMDATELAVLFLDAKMCIRRFTPAMTKLLPLHASDVGRPIHTFASPFTRHGLQEDANRALEQRVHVEKPVEAEDGRFYLRRIIPYRAGDARMDGIVVTLLDVTAHLTAMAETRRLAAVLTDSSDAIMLLDPDGRITSWNRGAERMFGYSEAESKKLRIGDLMPEELRNDAAPALRSTLSGRAVAMLPTVRLTKDGRRLDVLITTTVLTDDAGRPVAIAETDRDVTELMQAQRQVLTLNEDLERRIVARTEALAASESRLLGILVTATDGIVTSDRHGTIISVNPAGLRMFGYGERTLVGQNIKVLMQPADGASYDRYLADCLRSAGAVDWSSGREIQARRRDGATFPVDISLSRFQDGNGAMFMAILRDVSERRDMERHLGVVREEEQARIARDIHDGLGGLITGIGMLAKTIHVSAERAASPLAGQLGSLVDFVREADAQVRQIAYGLVPVAATPEGLGIALQRLAARHDTPAGPRCKFQGQPRTSLHDAQAATQLYYIAQEAVSNAFRHGAPTCVTIELAEHDDRLELSVRDDGNGGSALAGDGMGLQTMRYRAVQVGASLEIEGKAGHGTVILCRLPKLSPGERSLAAGQE